MSESETVSPVLVEQLRQLIKALGFNSMGQIIACVHETELTTSQIIALTLVHKFGAHSISKLAFELGLSLSATSHLIDQLVRRDMLERLEDPEDRRQKILRLAPAGQAILDRLLQARMQSIAEILHNLPGELQHELEQMLAIVLPYLAPGSCPTAPQADEPGR